MLRPTGNTAPNATIASALLLTWAALTYALRLCRKYTKRDKWGYDDTAMTVAFFLGVANVVTLCYAISKGYGEPWATFAHADKLVIEKALYAASILYVTAMGFTRMSASLFAERLLALDAKLAPCHLPLVLYGIWTCAATIAVALRGNVVDPWSTRNGSTALFIRYMGVEISGVALDVLVISLSIRVIWPLRIPVSRRMILIAIFASRLFIVPVVILRLWKLKPSESTLIRPRLTTTVYNQIALHSAFMLASSTHIVPFLKPYCEGYYPDTHSFVDASRYNARAKATSDLRCIGLPLGAKGSNYSGSAARRDSAVLPTDPSAAMELRFITEA